MRGYTALLRLPAEGAPEDMVLAQFDDLERWGRELPSLALGWHEFKESDFEIDEPEPVELKTPEGGWPKLFDGVDADKAFDLARTRYRNRMFIDQRFIKIDKDTP